MSNNISNDKILAHLDRVLYDQRPITADVFLDNYCNNKCPYCTYRRWKFDADARSMSYENFVKYATRLKELGVLGIILTGGGEPTIATDFNKITAWLEANEFHYGVNTNFNVFQHLKPDYLKVSLDGYDDRSYYDNRGVHMYTTVRNNIIKYAEWKAINSPKTSLGIQMLAKSVSDVELFYAANKDLPVDYISIRPMESIGGTYYKTLRYAVDTDPNEITKKIENIASIDPRVILNYKWKLLDRQEGSCVAQWAQIAINELGEVMYCCHKPHQIIGHILDKDILSKKTLASTNMQLCDIPCRMTAPNMQVASLLSKKTDENFI